MSASTLYFGNYDGLRGLGVNLTLEDAMSASGQGQCDDAVAALLGKPYVAEQFAAMDADTIRAGLRETGGWDAEELADDDRNEHRALWLAACDVRENFGDLAQ